MTTHTPLRCAYSGMVGFTTGGDGYIVLLNSGNYPSFSSYGNETWLWNSLTGNGNEDWTNISTSFIDSKGPLGPSVNNVVMSARINQAMAFDGTNVMLFGGQGSSSTAGAFADTWTFSPTTSTWTLQHPTTSPSARYQAEAAYLSGTGSVMFGGQNAGWILGETWVWNGTTWAQTTVANGKGPAARISHAMAASTSLVTLFGGSGTSNNLFGDTWTFDGSTWTQVSVANGKGPAARSGHVMSYDSHNSKYVMFGGTNGAAFLNDTWTFDGTTWTQVAVANGKGPAARIGAQMAFDSQNNLSIMYGGVDAATMYPSNSTWAFDGSALTWTKL